MKTTSSANEYHLLDALRAIAQEGLTYAHDEYAKARYHKILELVSKEYSACTGLDSETIQELFLQEQGCITPKVGVDAAVINDRGAVLVLKRSDGTWGMPGGWSDVGEAPFQTGIREAFEETGLKLTPIGYVGITHKSPLSHPGFVSQVNICVAMQPVPVDAKVSLSHEHSEYKWIQKPEIETISPWHAGHKRVLPYIFVAYQKQNFIPDIQEP